MSWTLFTQIIILALLGACVLLAVLKAVYEDSPPTTPSRKRLVFYGPTRPEVIVEDGDMWMRTDTNQTHIWSSDENDWKEV